MPTARDDEARAEPVAALLASTIGALAAADGLVSPKRFEAAMGAAQAVGNVLGEPSLVRVLTLRALSAPQDPRAAVLALKPHAADLAAPDRAAVMRALADLVGDDAKPAVAGLSSDLAAALGVPLPDRLRREAGGVRDALGHLADRAMRLVRSEASVVAAARDFAGEFGDGQLPRRHRRRTADRRRSRIGRRPRIGARTRSR